jgi:hypothetical protein
VLFVVPIVGFASIVLVRAAQLKKPGVKVSAGSAGQNVDRVVVRAGQPARLADLLRGHWAIETLHHLSDVTFAEDASQIRTGAGPSVTACLRNLVIGVLCQAGPVNVAAAPTPPRPRPTPPPRHPRHQIRMKPTSRQNDGALPAGIRASELLLLTQTNLKSTKPPSIVHAPVCRKCEWGGHSVAALTRVATRAAAQLRQQV